MKLYIVPLILLICHELSLTSAYIRSIQRVRWTTSSIGPLSLCSSTDVDRDQTSDLETSVVGGLDKEVDVSLEQTEMRTSDESIAVSESESERASSVLASTPTAPATPVATINITERTSLCLDFDMIMTELRSATITVLGKELIQFQQAQSQSDIELSYMMVEEMFPKLNDFPLRSELNMEPLLVMLETNSAPPEVEDLRQFTIDMEQLIEINKFFDAHTDQLSLYQEFNEQMRLPEELGETFYEAFDDDDNLNAEKYPTIMRLRNNVNDLKSRIVSKLNNIRSQQSMKEKIADSGYEIVEGRYCLMLKNTFKKGIGIVHGASNTGRTIYVEPFELVDMTNEMKSYQGQLKVEENRILYEMCKCINQHRSEIRRSVTIAAQIDILRAKASIGRAIGGVIPEVNTQGILSCRNAKHPVLLLRKYHETLAASKARAGVHYNKNTVESLLEPVKSTVVGNNIELDEHCKALVISGPNAGGKTIVLKTAGLFAMMVKYSIPIPADQGARVDLFNVLADIGDMQNVSGDLSTFSGHLVVCREILQSVKRLYKAKKRNDATADEKVMTMDTSSEVEGQKGGEERAGEYSLVLLDEIGTGTEPGQGAALAQAILEDLIAQDSRIIVTTHYARIKEMCTTDTRFKISAMEFVDNLPTYKLRLGSIGESFALEAGRRMSLPENVLERADGLLDEASRKTLNLQRRLEEEIDLARRQQEELDNKLDLIQEQEDEIEVLKQTIEKEKMAILSGNEVSFLDELKAKERELDSLIKEARRAVEEKATMTKTERVRIVEDIKVEVKSMRIDTEVAQVEAALEEEEEIATPLVKDEPIEIGKSLIILERGGIFGSKGIVTKRNKGRGRVHLRVAGVEVKMERHLLGYPLPPKNTLEMKVDSIDPDDPEAMSKLTSKERQMLEMKKSLVDIGSSGSGGGTSSKGGVTSQNTIKRSVQNTLDLAGHKYDRCESLTRNRLSRAMDNGDAHLFIHHGKASKTSSGNKNKLQTYLRGNPFVKKIADQGEYSQVELFTEEEFVSM